METIEHIMEKLKEFNEKCHKVHRKKWRSLDV
jgi:hypothetical protein